MDSWVLLVQIKPAYQRAVLFKTDKLYVLCKSNSLHTWNCSQREWAPLINIPLVDEERGSQCCAIKCEKALKSVHVKSGERPFTLKHFYCGSKSPKWLGNKGREAYFERPLSKGIEPRSRALEEPSGGRYSVYQLLTVALPPARAAERSPYNLSNPCKWRFACFCSCSMEYLNVTSINSCLNCFHPKVG